MTLGWKGIHFYVFLKKKKNERKTNSSLLTFTLTGALNDKSQICDYFHVTEHHSVTGYSCLMFPSDPDECIPLFGGGGVSSKIYFLMFAFDLLYIKEFRRAWICDVVLRRQIKSCRNQIRNENPLPLVSIWLVYSARQGLKEKTLKSKKNYFTLFLKNNWSCLPCSQHGLEISDILPLIRGAHYRWTSFICFNVPISLHTHTAK